MKVLFLVSGLGLGNSTRCYAVIKQLVNLGASCHVMTSGRGTEYFAERPEVASLHEMPVLSFGTDGPRISLGRTLLKAPELVRACLEKTRRLREVLDEVQPSLGVIDSEYMVAPFRVAGVPVIAINNSRFLFSRFAGSKKPCSLWLHFWTVEFLDYLFHQWAPEMVLCPTPEVVSRSDRFREVGLIVREGLDRPGEDRIRPQEIRRALYVPGGSQLSRTLELPLSQLPFPVETAEGEICGALRAADCLIINGGWSSISEAVALNKPTISIPLPGHSEQYFNAGLLEYWGRGQRLTPETMVPSLRRQYAQNRWDHTPSDHFRPALDGAHRAALAILEFIRR